MDQCLALGWLWQIYLPAACRSAVRLHTHIYTHRHTQTNTYVCIYITALHTHAAPHFFVMQVNPFYSYCSAHQSSTSTHSHSPTSPRSTHTPNAFVSMEQPPLDRDGERGRGVVAAAAHVTAFFSSCERRNNQHISCHTPPHSHTHTHIQPYTMCGMKKGSGCGSTRLRPELMYVCASSW